MHNVMCMQDRYQTVIVRYNPLSVAAFPDLDINFRDQFELFFSIGLIQYTPIVNNELQKVFKNKTQVTNNSTFMCNNRKPVPYW